MSLSLLLHPEVTAKRAKPAKIKLRIQSRVMAFSGGNQ
jgi:hypothetical protein